MKESDKQAWLQACNEWHANSGGKDLGQFMFEYALAHRDKQAEPVAEVLRGLLVRSSIPVGYTGPLYTAPPAQPEQPSGDPVIMNCPHCFFVFDGREQLSSPETWGDEAQASRKGINPLPTNPRPPAPPNPPPAQQAELVPFKYTVAAQAMRDEWKFHGGTIHGPMVETVCMPESKYFEFRRKLSRVMPEAAPAVAQEPVKYAKYFALADTEGKFIKKNYYSGQLEVYEEKHQVPTSHKATSCMEVFVTKTPPAVAVNEQMLSALKLYIAHAGEPECAIWRHVQAQVNTAIAAAEAAKKGGV